MTHFKSPRLHGKFTVSVLAAAVMLATAGSAMAVEATITDGNYKFGSGYYPYSECRVVNSTDGDASGNKITLEGGSYNSGFVTGFSSAGNANGNETVINGVEVKG